MSDIILDGDNVFVDGRATYLRMPDLLLDAPDRRTPSGDFRRALVHDFNDGLTINWGGDYPAGVTIQGQVQIPAGLTVRGRDVGEALAAYEKRIRVLEEQVSVLMAIAAG